MLRQTITGQLRVCSRTVCLVVDSCPRTHTWTYHTPRAHCPIPTLQPTSTTDGVRVVNTTPSSWSFLTLLFPTKYLTRRMSETAVTIAPRVCRPQRCARPAASAFQAVARGSGAAAVMAARGDALTGPGVTVPGAVPFAPRRPTVALTRKAARSTRKRRVLQVLLFGRKCATTSSVLRWAWCRA